MHIFTSASPFFSSHAWWCTFQMNCLNQWAETLYYKLPLIAEPYCRTRCEQDWSRYYGITPPSHPTEPTPDSPNQPLPRYVTAISPALNGGNYLNSIREVLYCFLFAVKSYLCVVGGDYDWCVWYRRLDLRGSFMVVCTRTFLAVKEHDVIFKYDKWTFFKEVFI